jgi:hypothetical protein
MPQTFQKNIQAQLGKGLHKSTPTNVVRTVNDANKSLPYDIAGGGNQPYTGPVKNAAQGGLPSGTNGAGQSPVAGTGNPLLPFTK